MTAGFHSESFPWNIDGKDYKLNTIWWASAWI